MPPKFFSLIYYNSPGPSECEGSWPVPFSRPTNATDSASLEREWQYNSRSELAEATIGTNAYGYAYDTIGNREWTVLNGVTNTYAANALNQYTTIPRPSGSPCSPLYDADGNLVNDRTLTYAYDAENRLVSATSLSMTNGTVRVLNAYDHRHRRITKTVQRLAVFIAPPPSLPVQRREWRDVETNTYVWDGNDIVLERIALTNGTSRVCEYFWGPDMSGVEQGAGGVGGLLAASMDGVFYIPCYDHNGNVVRYVSESGAVATAYVYDPYGNVVESTAPLSADFTFGFSTKVHDHETGLVGYQRRFLRPVIGRWLNRDPIEEEGGENLYALVENNPVLFFDSLGLQLPYLGDFGDPVSLPYYENTPPYGPYHPNVSDGLSYGEGGMKYFFGDGSDEYIPVDQLGLSSNVQDYFDPCRHRKGDWKGLKDLLRIGNWSKAGPGRVSVTLEGSLSFTGKCWTYYGFLKAESEDFDFDPRPWWQRDKKWSVPWKESVTRIIAGVGWLADANKFEMHFTGVLHVTGKGRCP